MECPSKQIMLIAREVGKSNDWLVAGLDIRFLHGGMGKFPPLCNCIHGLV